MKMTDGELLRRYAREHSEKAFEELVGRRINLVYSAALRQVNNDPHLAEDVTQAVFTDLAAKAAKLSQHPSLTAWLYTSTRFIAANTRRTEQRRAAREAEAHAMNAIDESRESAPDWARIRPLLDDAMHTLPAQDREAVLLRHFERRSYAEIGGVLGLSEDSARMRVNRALEKLHETLARRGVTSTALALAGLLGSNAAGAAPAHLTAKVARGAMTGMAGSHGLFKLLASKAGMASFSAVVVAAIALIAITKHAGMDSLTNAGTAVPLTNVDLAVAPRPASQVRGPGDDAVTKGPILHLQIVTADSGKPVPMVPVEVIGWGQGANIKRTDLVSDRLGRCNVPYWSDAPRLEVITHKEPFADARAVWQPPLGDVIPSNYVLQVERAVAIGGTVVDADGTPVPGATVTWRTSVPNPSLGRPPRSNEFYGTDYEATADQTGRWQLTRMAEAIMPYLVGGAKESNNVDSSLLFTSRDAAAEKELRGGTYIFKMSPTTIARGTVVDVNGAPIADASVWLLASGRSGKTGSDGSFAIPGCKPEHQPVSASSPDCPAVTMKVDIGQNAAPVCLVLRPGKVLRLRVVDDEGKPVPHAEVFQFNPTLDGKGGRTWYPEFPAMMKTDQEGRLKRKAELDAELGFSVLSDFEPFIGRWPVWDHPEFIIRPDGEEHVITLSRRAIEGQQAATQTP